MIRGRASKEKRGDASGGHVSGLVLLCPCSWTWKSLYIYFCILARLGDGFGFVGIHMVNQCPHTHDHDRTASQEIIREKCNLALNAPNYVTLAADIDILIPVTSNRNNRTYANVHCALCHGEDDFEYWKAPVSNLSECYLTEMALNFQAGIPLNERNPNSSCIPWGRIIARPNDRLKLRLEEVAAGNWGKQRYSKFCFDERRFPKCLSAMDHTTGSNSVKSKHDKCNEPLLGLSEISSELQ